MAFETTKKVNFQLAVSGESALVGALRNVSARLSENATQANFLRSAFTGLVGGAGAGGFVGMINGAIDAKARLYDLGLQTGINVERLGGLAKVAQYSNTELTDIASASNKLSKALATNNEDSKGAAQGIKALGLNFDAFKKLGADEQLLAVANAMNGFEDGTGKSATAMLIFGKTGATLLPFLKELAERGNMVSKQTTESALAAKQYQDNLVTLRGAGEGLAQTLLEPMLPSLVAFTNQMASAKTWAERLGIAFGNVRDNLGFSKIDVQRRALEGLNLDIVATTADYNDMAAALSREPYNRALVQRVQELSDKLAGLRKQAAGSSESLKQALGQPNRLPSDWLRADKDTSPAARKRLPDFATSDTGPYDVIMGKIREKMALDQAELDLGRELTASERFQAEVYADVDKNFSKLTVSKMLGIDAEVQLAFAMGKRREAQRDETKWLEESRKETEKAVDAQAAHVKQYEDEITTLQRTYEEYGMTAEAIERNAIARVRDAAALVLQRRGIDDMNSAQSELNRLLEYQAKLLGDTADLRAAIAKKKAADRDDPMTGAKNAVQAYLEEISAAGTNTQRVVGSALHGLEDGLTDLFKKGKWDAHSFIDALIAEFIRLRVVQPLLANIFGGGGLFGSLFGGGGASAIGNMGAAFLIPGFANGGAVSSGRPIMVGERGPELFVPQTAGAIVPNGATAGGQRVVLTTHNVFNIDSRTDRGQVLQLVAQGVQVGNRQLVETLHAQGVL
jgi:lambda family phage tail tape measure protein